MWFAMFDHLAPIGPSIAAAPSGVRYRPKSRASARMTIAAVTRAASRKAGLGRDCRAAASPLPRATWKGAVQAMLANRTIIGAFAARPRVLTALDPTALKPSGLPKHVR